MTVRRLAFDLHGLVSFSLETESSWIQDYFAQEYGFASASNGNAAWQVELHMRHSTIPRSPGGAYTFHAHKAAARWFYRIELGEERIRIDAVGNRASVPMVQHMLLGEAAAW
jgi:hypothetical protein